MVEWDALIRFASGGLTYWSAITPGQIPEVGAEVQAFPDDGPISMFQGPERVIVEEYLAPLPTSVNPIICIGVNYPAHANEVNITIPSDPVQWYKPPASLADPYADIPVSARLATNFLDYEGEMVIVTSKPARDVREADARDYILGYTVGNDLTLRRFQDSKRSGGQYTYAKGLDKFAPLGPSLLSPAQFAAKQRHIVTKVNGNEYQNAPINLIHSPEKLISFLSQGRTLPAGTAIMTGTPNGVGWSRDPQVNLKDGDVVEVEIEDIGVLKNKIQYTQP